MPKELLHSTKLEVSHVVHRWLMSEAPGRHTFFTSNRFLASALLSALTSGALAFAAADEPASGMSMSAI